MADEKKFNVEQAFNMLADALYSALPTDSAEVVRRRVLGVLKANERIALENLIDEKRKSYTKPE